MPDGINIETASYIIARQIPNFLVYNVLGTDTMTLQADLVKGQVLATLIS